MEILVEAYGRAAGGGSGLVQNVSFLGLNFRHAKPTILSARGYSVLLGGGDYAMVKAGAIVAEGVDGLRVAGCSFSRLDGNAVVLHGYVRRAVLADNVFFSLGANAIVSWGAAEFQEGTRGTNPEGTHIIGNYAHEIGLLEKQERERRQVGPEVGPTSAFYSCIPTGMHGPTCIFWANLTLFSLGLFLLPSAVGARRGRAERLFQRPTGGVEL